MKKDSTIIHIQLIWLWICMFYWQDNHFDKDKDDSFRFIGNKHRIKNRFIVDSINKMMLEREKNIRFICSFTILWKYNNNNIVCNEFALSKSHKRWKQTYALSLTYISYSLVFALIMNGAVCIQIYYLHIRGT